MPDIYTAIAFDSGGVASGPMTATFMLQFMMGASITHGGDVLCDAFGVVALVAMVPLISIQTVGLIYEKKKRLLQKLPSLTVILILLSFGRRRHNELCNICC